MTRRGFTLVEVLLVLAIMVAIAAMAAPALRGLMQDAGLRSAADQVRIEWTKAHVKAMKSGRIQVFRFEQDGTKFTVEPWAAADDETEAAPPVQGFGPTDEKVAPLDKTLEVTLPEGVTFVAGAAALQARSQQLQEDIQQASHEKGDWSQPVLFYPDGSSSDAYVIVANERKVAIRVELRGMTGAVKLSEITDQDELMQESENAQ